MQPESTLALILAQPPETPLRALLHPYDRYSLAMDLEDAGNPAPWATVLEWETVNDVARWVERAERKAA